jgi:hypothetical protein
MKKHILPASALIAALTFSCASYAQNRESAVTAGNGAIAGPAGLVVGGTGGTTVGIMSDKNLPRFQEYVAGVHPYSYTYDDVVRVGVQLPPYGIAYYQLPPEFGASDYSYAIVNHRAVLVDPRTHQVIQVLY